MGCGASSSKPEVSQDLERSRARLTPPPGNPRPVVHLVFPALGESWINLVHATVQQGVPLGDEGLELLHACVSFPSRSIGEPVIERFGDVTMIAEMKKVFFEDTTNALGHNYKRLMCGPNGANDLSDIIELLRAEPLSKRGVVTFCGAGDGRVPCINSVQFLVRENELQAIYFARGQDAYKKYYADGLCLAAMASRVAKALGLASGWVTGFIASSHVYYADMPAIRDLLTLGESFLAGSGQGGV